MGSSSGGGSSGGDFALVLLGLPNPGGRVKKGDVVAEFDRQYMLNRLDDYKDSVIQAEANIKQKKANLAVSREAHDQQVRIAKSDMEKAKLDLQTLEVVSDIDAEKLKLAAEETARITSSSCRKSLCSRLRRKPTSTSRDYPGYIQDRIQNPFPTPRK